MKLTHQTRAVAVALCLVLSAHAWPLRQAAPAEVEGWDISALDAAAAEAGAKAEAPDAGPPEKLAAARAYMTRATFFYEAGRPPLYRLAVGDFRRVLRLQPGNREARERLDEIVSIYKSLGRPVPENGDDGDVHNDPRVGYKLRPQPVKLAGERKAVSLSETLPPRVGYVYELEGREGQTVSVGNEAGRNGAAFDVYATDSTPLASGVTEWRGALPRGGKCRIRIGPTARGLRYELKVAAE